MSSPQKPKQPTSRWNFLSQAVASVESGLDRILAEEDDTTKKSKPQPITTLPENGSISKLSTESRRSESANRTNDRLQARLAQAMVKKGGSRATTPLPDSEPATRSETPDLTVTEDEETIQSIRDSGEQSSLDIQRGDQTTPVHALNATSVPVVEVVPALADGSPGPRASSASTRRSQDTSSILDIRPSLSERPSTDNGRPSTELANGTVAAAGDSDTVLLNIQLAHEKTLSTLQEEINSYLERIDGLQRNLQILTQETIARTRQIKTDSDSTTSEKQLAAKDEKIALLIEEGTKLTKGEMQYRNTIKKLRVQATTLTKDQDAVRARAEKAEKAAALIQVRAEKAETEARQRNEQLKGLATTSSEVETITKERNALQSTLTEVRTQLIRANQRAEEAESRAQSDKLETERRKNAELSDDLSSVRVEKELIEEKLQRQIADLKQSISREKEQARHMETEMLAEQAVLESKLESFRLRAEEASSNDHGDSHAKLLRQVEALQSQYATASSNWQGIETTLLGRISALETERDEVTARESDVRRRLRDATNKAKNAMRDLEETQQTLHKLQDEGADESAEARRATGRAKQLAAEVAALHQELEAQKSRTEKDLHRRLEEERVKWLASLPQALPRVDSPVASLRKTPGGLFVDSLMSPLERPTSRRSSTHNVHDLGYHSRFNSSASFRGNGTIPETPSIHTPDEQDEFFAHVPMTPASATQADSHGRNVNDVISASTAGAGPSVQLVERLSTNVRRLESEKSAAKDEISRLSQQRDETRKEVVNLMREVEQKRTSDSRLKQVERQLGELTAKHQATLELLGEKTEQVDELRADIADVKQMYRHLADTMGK